MNYYNILLIGQLNFYLEILIPLLLLMRKQELRSCPVLRFLPIIAVGIGFVFMPSISFGPFGINYLIILCVVFLECWFLFKVGPLDALFYSVAAFAVQHIVWDLLFMLFELTKVTTQAAVLTLYFSLYISVFLLLYLFFPVFNARQGVKGRSLQFAASGFIITCVYVLASIVPWFYEWNLAFRLYALLCCIISLCLQYGIFDRDNLRRQNAALTQEKIVLEELLAREQKQYAITKDTIELINIKCHDLKHQIAALHNMSADERERGLTEVENAVMIYGSIAKTGNDTLDVILTEKSFLCERHGVHFTYMLDGESFSFMAPTDLLSLFGNALDNAIESVLKEPDRERRIIKLNAFEKRGCVGVHLENYCSERIRFKDGLPLTSKSDKVNHGFGVKSMTYIVNKYGGSLTMRQEGCLVSLDFVFPLSVKNRKDSKLAATA